MKLYSSMIAALLIAGLLIGCGGGANSTPQAVFESMKTAGKAEDYAGLLKCLTPESQDMMVGGMAVAGLMGNQMAKAFGKKPDADINALLKKHGIDPEKPLKMEPGKSDAVIAQLAGQIKDKPGFLAEFIKLADKKGQGPSPTKQMADATLKDVKITGDTAAGTIVTKVKGKDKESPISFKKIAGSWLIDLKAASKKPATK